MHYALFNKAKRIALLANKGDSAREILDRIQLAYENLPRWMQSGVVLWNKGTVEFENGSRIIAASSSSSSIRGKSMSFVYIDETAFLEHWDEFYASVFPTLSSGETTKMLLTSCVTKGTLLCTDKGIQDIDEFVNDSKTGFYTVDNYSVHGHNTLRTSNLFYNNGYTDTKIIQTRSGEVECSLNHKWFAYKNGVYDWVNTENLTTNDYLIEQINQQCYGTDDDISDFIPSTQFIKKPFNPPSKMTNDLAYFLGLFAAEGCAGFKKGGTGLTITCGDDVGFAFDNISLYYNVSKDKIHYNSGSKNMVEFLLYYGIDITKKAQDKTVPARILKSPKNIQQSWLRGYFDGDGTCSESKIGVCSTSKIMINQVKMMLMNMGIKCSYFKNEPKDTDGDIQGVYTGHRLEIYGESAFKYYNEIGFSIKRKAIRFDNTIKNIRNGGPNDIIPGSKRIFKENKVTGIWSGVCRNGDDFSRKFLLSIKDYIIENSYFNSKDIKFLYDYIISENLQIVPVKKVTKSKNYVYDFSLPEIDNDMFCHSVTYNGIIGHQTPNGLNHFYEFWKGATDGLPNAAGIIEKNGFVPIFAPWYRIPGRNEKWKDGILKSLNYDFDRFSQEYEGNFLGSSNSLLSSTTLKTLLPSTPIEKNDYTNQYIAPIKDHVYFIICDVSRGKGLDYSAFSVIDATTIPYVQVCTYRNNRITPTDYAAVILHIAKLYNTAYILVETNDLGEQVSYTLKYEFDYENLLYSESAGRSGKKLSSGFGKSVETGLRTTQSVKRLGCAVLKLLLEQRKLVLHDVATVRELATFSKHGDSFAAETGFHDDMVMGLVLFSFITQDAYFKDITNGDVLQHLRDYTDSEIYDDLIPFGMITSANDDGVKYVKIPGERGVWTEQSSGSEFSF